MTIQIDQSFVLSASHDDGRYPNPQSTTEKEKKALHNPPVNFFTPNLLPAELLPFLEDPPPLLVAVLT